MKAEQLLRAILPDVLINNFDVVSFEKTDQRFDIWLDEKKVQMKEDKRNGDIIAYGFGEYHESAIFPFVDVVPICMYASGNGLTSHAERFSVTIGICRSLTART